MTDKLPADASISTFMGLTKETPPGTSLPAATP